MLIWNRSIVPLGWRSATRVGLIAGLLVLPVDAEAVSPLTFAGPAGWQELCATMPDYCNTSLSRPATILDQVSIELLAAVNTAVNAAIEPRDEPFGHDAWRMAPEIGDCEDFALTKKQRLISAGWPKDDLRFATVLTEADEYHAVLTVDHAEGRLVLDNRFAAVQEMSALEASGYRVVAVEGEGASGAWRLTPFGSVVAMLLDTGPASR